MGLERLASVVQRKTNNYDTDVLLAIQQGMWAVINNRLPTGSPLDLPVDPGPRLTALRVLVDHLRATCFLLSDGVLPSGEGRGNVLRKIIRRAVRYASTLGIKGTEEIEQNKCDFL